MTRLVATFLFVALLPLAASAAGNCDAQAEAEQDQILREFSRQPPSKYDQEAYMSWSKNMNAALAAAAQRHEDCTRANRAAISPAAAAKVDECIAGSNRHMDELNRKYHGRYLTMQEQTTRRAEEQSLIDERMSCTDR